jgi:hypothetical protein
VQAEDACCCQLNLCFASSRQRLLRSSLSLSTPAMRVVSVEGYDVYAVEVHDRQDSRVDSAYSYCGGVASPPLQTLLILG